MESRHPLFRWFDSAPDGERRTQTALALRAGMSKSYLSQILNDKRSASPEDAMSLSLAVDGLVAPEEIVFWRVSARKPRAAKPKPKKRAA
jgi:DNA-binding transcriptional regulator YdaS (Cro superfamily)